LISVPAGMQRMPMGKFLLLTTLGSAIWSTILTVAGMYLGQNWETVLEFISRYQRVILVLIALGIVAFVVIRVNALRKRQQTAE